LKKHIAANVKRLLRYAFSVLSPIISYSWGKKKDDPFAFKLFCPQAGLKEGI